MRDGLRNGNKKVSRKFVLISIASKDKSLSFKKHINRKIKSVPPRININENLAKTSKVDVNFCVKFRVSDYCTQFLLIFAINLNQIKIYYPICKKP